MPQGSLRARWNSLLTILKSHRRILVAYSGGTDSAFLAYASREVLGQENVLAVTAMSPSLALAEREAAESLIALLKVPYLALDTYELENPLYAANPSNRCFYCKDELFGRFTPLAKERRMVVADGFNLSDRAEFRPGRKAADSWNVVHPLEDAALTKRDIRVLSRWLKLPTWNKPASPCLSSRIPYGTSVTAATLHQIDLAETVVRSEGFRVLRVRHFGLEARIEVPSAEIPRLEERDRWERICKQLIALGYEKVTVEREGFRSGRLNATIN